MQAKENKIIDLFSIQNTIFTIPVYQRNYNWTEKECKRLYNDIFEIGENKNIDSYFIGSIVYIHEGISSALEREFYIIDGQQRVTTLTLLFLALSHILKENEITENEASRIFNQYIINPFSKKEIKLKLIPSEDNGNLEILDKISNDKIEELNEYINTNMLKNYLFFKNNFRKLNKEEISYFLEGINKLIYIDVSLENGKDNPQRIFESLNSTGLDLSEGDLIRNHILINLERDKQNRIYKDIWIPIENNCEVVEKESIISYVSDFIRDYLTLKTREIPNKNKVFEEFKKFYIENFDEKLEELKKYSKAYSSIIKPNTEKDKDIRKELEYLRSLDQTVINPFLIGIISDYHEQELEKEELIEILDLLQSYLWRRYITERKSNELNKIFSKIYPKIFEENNYYENLKIELINDKFPTDDELKNSLKTKNVYKDKEKLNYVFKKLENYNHNELIDFNNEKITIEHIFPQKPSKSWESSYSTNEFEMMASLKDTISNLTLTGSNPNLSNKSFIEKRDDEAHGYKNSKLYLNRFLGNLDEWNLVLMGERFESLYKDIIKIWKRPENKKIIFNDIEKIVFVLKGKNTSGTGRLLSNGKFEVSKGTTIALESDNSISVLEKNRRTIKELLSQNLIKKLDDKYIFTENYITSPSTAAKLILGYSTNGWKEWKTYEGKLLSDYRG